MTPPRVEPGQVWMWTAHSIVAHEPVTFYVLISEINTSKDGDFIGQAVAQYSDQSFVYEGHGPYYFADFFEMPTPTLVTDNNRINMIKMLMV